MSENRVAYFGTNGSRAGHDVITIQGEFSNEEISFIRSIDDKIPHKDPVTVSHITYGNYLGIYINASPDDKRGSSKTVVFVENPTTIAEVVDIIMANPFLEQQFTKVTALIKQDGNKKH